MISPRANRLQSQNKKPQQQYAYKSPTPRVVSKSPPGVKNQLSPKDFDTKSNKSHHSRKSGRSVRSGRSKTSLKSFQTIKDRVLLSKHEPCHPVGYNQKQIKDSIDYIFQKYDDNHNDLLERNQVLVLVRDALKHIGSKHQPTELQIKEFIQHVDKNNDGQLSREQLQKAFLRASKNLA